ncbi:Uu.00g087990.m01.CDS01 [Anthostomella pinea]|uniref:Uu.00g087990.m01.CDS01 n=1 Tax=Anthostomella pinea TaxID=933095 RepID=A0AAI8VH12_9PEZI|nr:Uu.00g087990.m01.CDS01 [Anthostomella pinea]
MANGGREQAARDTVLGLVGHGADDPGDGTNSITLEDPDQEDIAMADAAIVSTPQPKIASNPSVQDSASSAHLTHSTSGLNSSAFLTTTPSSGGKRLRHILLSSSTKTTPSTTTSNLEDSRDIRHVEPERPYEDREDDEIGGDDDGTEIGEGYQPHASSRGGKSARNHPETGQLRVPTRRSARIGAKTLLARGSGPSDALCGSLSDGSTSVSHDNRVRKKQRRVKSTSRLTGTAGIVRRSARLAKPLSVFHKYPDLPEEMKIMIWEAAISPRLVYLCNRLNISLPTAVHIPTTPGIQNSLPTWFAACGLSTWVAEKNYTKLFSLHHFQPPSIDLTTCQDVNINADIVVFEPCHSGCRAMYCARAQYSEQDRSQVRFLAVQIDSPNLVAAAEPGWVSVGRSWPNVETLYFIKGGVKRPEKQEKAMIRVKEDNHDSNLRKAFDEWKKNAGKYEKVASLQFVKVVDQEPQMKNEKDGDKKAKDRYKSVDDRKTGLPKDIIIG